MRLIAIFVLIFVATSCATSPRPPLVKGFEHARSLGRDFWLITAPKDVHGRFEAIGHFSYCYYRKKNLGLCDRLSPSPSGQLAVYQAASTGYIFLFNTHTGISTQLTTEFSGLMQSASWQERENTVTVQVGDIGFEQDISLSYAQTDGT